MLVANLDPTLTRRDAPEDPLEAVEAFPDGLVTAEVAAIMTRGNDAPDREAAEAALVEHVATGRVARIALGDGVLWRPAGAPSRPARRAAPRPFDGGAVSIRPVASAPRPAPLGRGARARSHRRAARRAEEAGFAFVTVSDHFHPWTRRQGQSPFVWSVLGAIAQVTERVEVGTAVTCPTVRTHPAIIAQAAATTAAMMDGRFFLGVGTGRAAQRGDPRRPVAAGGRAPRRCSRRPSRSCARCGRARSCAPTTATHYVVEDARLFTLPVDAAAVDRLGLRAAGRRRSPDGSATATCTSRPSPSSSSAFREAGGAGKPCYAKLDTCVAEDDAPARRIAHETWPTSALGGELGQQLALPEHYEQATAGVEEDEVAEAILCSGDPQRHLDAIRELAEAGFDHVLVQQCGEDQERFIRFYADEVLPRAQRSDAA